MGKEENGEYCREGKQKLVWYKLWYKEKGSKENGLRKKTEDNIKKKTEE